MDAVAYALATQIPASASAPSIPPAGFAANEERYGHSQSTLSDGTVLVTGGQLTTSGSPTNTVRSYDPATAVWTSKTALPYSPYNHAQSTLDDGTVLVTGGAYSYFQSYTRSYDPVANTWTTKTNVPKSVYHHGQSTLNDGTVLVTGGQSNSEVYSYDPVGNTWTSKASLPFDLFRHGQSKLNDGTVLVTGGYENGTSSGYRTANVRSYDLVTNTWTNKAALPADRYDHSQSTLTDGSVIVAGGESPSTNETNTVLSYSPVSNSWTTLNPMTETKSLQAQSSLANNFVLITGGVDGGQEKRTVELHKIGADVPTPGRAALLGYLAST